MSWIAVGIGGGLIAGGGLMSALGGGNDEEIYDPYAEQRKKYTDYLSGKLGTSTPYKYNEAFNINQPNIEKSAEDTILGYLKNPTKNVTDYSAATKQYSEASKASMAETYADEMNKTKDMYNRLGLVSSTPGLTAQQDVASSQRTAQNLFDSELMYKNLDRQLSAQGLDVTQLNSMLGQAGTLGQTQRQSQMYSQGASEADIQRMTDEEQQYASLMASLLGQNPAERTLTPNIWSQLGGTLTTLGQVGANAGIAGMNSNSGSNSGISDIGGGNTTNSHYKLINGKLTYVP